MLPTLREGQLCLFASGSAIKEGDIVLAKTQKREIVKRVWAGRTATMLLGDNARESTSYVVDRQTAIVGKLIWPKSHRF